MANTENRFVRIEDWRGNAYYPRSESASSTAGSVTDSASASSDPTATTYTDGQKIADSYANGGTSIVLTSSSERQTIFSTYLSNIPFGMTSIGIRLKSSDGTTKVSLIEVNTYFVDASGSTPTVIPLNQTMITGEMIGKVNEYTTVGITTEYKGYATSSTFLKVELILLPDVNATITFDQIAVAMEMPAKAVETLDIYMEGSVMVVEKKS